MRRKVLDRVRSLAKDPKAFIAHYVKRACDSLDSPRRLESLKVGIESRIS